MASQALVLKRPAPIAKRLQASLALAPLAAVATGFWWMAMLAPLSMYALVLATAFLAFVTVAPTGSSLRIHLLERRNELARREQRAARLNRLPVASFGRGTLAELTQLVDNIRACDPELGTRMNLEGLLDRHVTLTLAYERALTAVELGERARLERMRDGYRSDPGANRKRLEMCERRLACLTECEAKVEELADELAILSDLLHLIAQRAACPVVPERDDLVERQLDQLDDDVIARKQVAELQ